MVVTRGVTETFYIYNESAERFIILIDTRLHKNSHHCSANP